MTQEQQRRAIAEEARQLAEKFERLTALGGLSVASNADLAIARLARMIEQLATE